MKKISYKTISEKLPPKELKKIIGGGSGFFCICQNPNSGEVYQVLMDGFSCMECNTSVGCGYNTPALDCLWIP